MKELNYNNLMSEDATVPSTSEPNYDTGPELTSISLTIIISLAAVLENLLVILAVCCVPNLRKKSNVLIVNIAVADVLSSLSNPFLMFILKNDSLTSCIVARMLIVVTWSLMLVLAVSIERFLAVASPIKYRYIVTKRKLIIVCALFWVLPCIFLGLAIYTQKWIPFFSAHCALTIIVGVVYPLIFIILKRKTNRHDAGSVSGAARQARLRSVFITFSILIFSLCLTLLPAQVLAFCYFYQWISGELAANIFDVLLPILMLNSALNPIVYWWRIPEFREGYRSCLCYLKHRERNEGNNRKENIINEGNELG